MSDLSTLSAALTTAVDAVLGEAVPCVAPAAQLAVRWRGAEVCHRCYGWLDPETRRQPTTPDTLFDLASVTKPVVAVTFLALVEAGLTGLDQPVAEVLPALSGMRPIRAYEDPLVPGTFVEVAAAAPINGARITFRQLLAHTSGLPPGRVLYRARTPAAARELALSADWAYLPETRSIYSDLGMIVLGLAIEALARQPLDLVVRQRVLEPAGLRHTCYLPLGMPTTSLLVAPTELCGWRQRRIVGQVHDENAAALGGVAGHAGLFGSARDLAVFADLLLHSGPPLLGPAMVAEMLRLQTRNGDVRRGLGVVLRSSDPDSSGYAFSASAFGHTGFTGTSFWADPARALVVALLTNDVYHGRSGRGIGALRVALHQAIVRTIDALS